MDMTIKGIVLASTLLPALLLTNQARSKTVCIQDFDSGTKLNLATGAKSGRVVEATLATEKSKTGDSAVRLSYDFKGTEGTAHVYARVDFMPKGDLSGITADKLIIWIYGDHSCNTASLEFQDAKGEWFSFSGRMLDWTGWRSIGCPLARPDATWGYEGAGKGVFKWPLAKASVGVSKRDNCEPLMGTVAPSGTVFIDSLEAELPVNESSPGTRLFNLSAFTPSEYSWITFTGDKGGTVEFSLSKETVRQGEWAAKLSYDFRRTSGSGVAVCAGIRQNTTRSPDRLGRISLWVYGDLTGQSLVVDLRDAEKNHFVYSRVIDWRGWRRLEWALDTPERVYRESDGKTVEGGSLAFPIIASSIMVAKKKDAVLPTGTVYLSEFVASVEGPVADWDLRDRVPAPQTARPAFPLHPKAHMEMINGRQALVVDGKPFIVLGAQCDSWRSIRQDKRVVEFFDTYKEAGATAVGMDILWSKIEPREDEYDFSFLDWCVRQAESRGLKLVLQLYLSDVCGKTNDGHNYPPAFILSNPQRFTRICPPPPFAPGNPVLCPNNPNLLEREIKLVHTLADYLREKDTSRTVIMLQVNNEIGGMLTVYSKCTGGGWVCDCPVCNAKKARLREEGRLEKTLSLLPPDHRTLSENRGFTTMSFADEERALSDEIAKTYDLPIYLNSPGWPTDVTTVFLSTCPNVDVVGADTVVAANDHSLYSIAADYLSGRNAYFSAESPTEDPNTLRHLGELATFSVLRGGGIGNLLWECYIHTVVDDPPLRPLYKEGVRPLACAMSQILETRGTPDQAGWYKTDEARYGVLPDDKTIPYCLIDAAGGKRLVTAESFSLVVGGHTFKISGTRAGIIAKSGNSEFAIASGRADIAFESDVKPVLEDGAWDGNRWIKASDLELRNAGREWSFHIEGGRCLRLSLVAPAPSSAPAQEVAFLELDVFNNWAQTPGSEFAASISVRALQDIPASSVMLELPNGWNAVGESRLSLPHLKKGELFSGKIRYAVPANAETGKLFPLTAKLYGDSGKLLTKTGQVLYTAKPCQGMGAPSHCR